MRVASAFALALLLTHAAARGASDPPQETIAPGADIQRTLNRARTGATIVFRSGAYDIENRLRLKSGVSLRGEPGAVLKVTAAHGVFVGGGVRDIRISGFVFDGGRSGGPGITSGAIVIANNGAVPSRNIVIEDNVFENWTSSNALYLWHTERTIVRRNIFRHGRQGISWRTDDARVGPLTTVIVADNVITDMTRMGIETGFATPVADVHIDRNKLARIRGAERIAISMVGHVTSGTLIGNEISDQYWAIEIGGRSKFSVTVARNVMTDCEWGISISRAPGSVIEDNVFTRVRHPLSEDGGYDNTEWVGVNTIDGRQRSGWVGPGAVPHGPYLQKPAVHQPRH